MEPRSFKTLLALGKQGAASQSSTNQDSEPLQGFYFLNVLVFSKDRPFQLQQFLRSMHQHLLAKKQSKPLQLMTGRMAMSPSGSPLQVIELETTCWCTIHVLYTYSDEAKYESQYNRVKQEFPWANFVREQDQNVQVQTKAIIDNQNQQFMLPSKYELRPFFSFMVDDMIFFRDLNLHTCMLTLEESQSSYALHLKLSPNICYSHTANKLITLPKFEAAESVKLNGQAEVAQVISTHSQMNNRSEDDNSVGSGLLGSSSAQAATMVGARTSINSSLSGYVERDSSVNSQQTTEQQLRLTFLKFRRSETELDWNYPFDFCGSIYRLQSVRDVVDKIVPLTKIARPNTFEFEGNKVVKYNMLARNQPYSLCLNWPVMTVITVNKVQDVYNTPVYRLQQVEESKEEKKGEVDPRAEEEACLEYMNTLLEQHHIINLEHYREQIFNAVHVGDFVSTPENQNPANSFTQQNAEKPKVCIIMPFFNTNPAYMKEAVESIVVNQTYKGRIDLIIVDDGSTNMRTVAYLESLPQAFPDRVRIISLPANRGLPEALNAGMQVASEMQADFIARMDSDDISVSSRIETQVNFMQRNRDIDILGSNIMQFTDQQRSAETCRIIGYPTIDSLIKHNMLFYCCLAHPSVMFRAETTRNRIVYNTDDPDVRAFEDYELWLRLIHSPEPPKFANIGTVLLLHRKHGANKSSNVSFEAEVPMKVNVLSNYYVDGDLRDALQQSPQITEEFIKVTGRMTRSDTFSNLKQKKNLQKIFEQVSKGYKLKLKALNADPSRQLHLTSNGIDFDKVALDFILKCLENRQQELAVHSVTNDKDMDAFKGLINSGALKRMLITPKKQM